MLRPLRVSEEAEENDRKAHLERERKPGIPEGEGALWNRLEEDPTRVLSGIHNWPARQQARGSPEATEAKAPEGRRRNGAGTSSNSPISKERMNLSSVESHVFSE